MLSYNKKLKQERLSLASPTPSPTPKPQGISSVLNKVSINVRFVTKKSK